MLLISTNQPRFSIISHERGKDLPWTGLMCSEVPVNPQLLTMVIYMLVYSDAS